MRTKLADLFIPIAIFCILLILADHGLGFVGFPSEAGLSVAHKPNYVDKREDIDFTYTIRTNSRSIRYREIPAKKAAGEFRVVVLGDSFTEGVGVEAEQTWPALIEKSFGDTNYGKNTLFINCGLIGAGPAQYTRILQRIGLEYNPDLVLLVLFANDVADTIMISEQNLLTSEGWFIDRSVYPKRKGVKAFLYFLIPRVYTLFETATMNLQNHIKARGSKDIVRNLTSYARRQGITESRIEEWQKRLPPEWVLAVNEGHMEPYKLAHGLLCPDIWLEALDLSTPASEKNWQIAESILSRIHRLCREQNVPLAVAYAPVAYQYDPTYVSPLMRVGVQIRKEWLVEGSEFQKRIGQWTVREGLPFLDMTPAFRKEAALRPGVLQFKTDTHWTPEGHQVAADLIEAWLLENHLVPQKVRPSPIREKFYSLT